MTIIISPIAADGSRTLPTGEHIYQCAYVDRDGGVTKPMKAKVYQDGSISCPDYPSSVGIYFLLDGKIFRVYSYGDKP